MSYFSNFEKIEYDGRTVSNILTSVLPSRLNIDKTFIYQKYKIVEGETPESVSEKLYGDSKLFWVLLTVNAIIDPFTEWPIRESDLEEYVTLKYGSLNGIHHFFDNQAGRICDDFDESAYREMDVADLPFYIIPVTNFSEEKTINETKRDILAINPGLVNSYVEVYGRAIEGKV